MGLVSTLLERRSFPPSVKDLDRWMDAQVFGPTTWTGKTLSTTDSMRVVAVYACVRILSEDIGMLPLHLYRRLSGGGKERDLNHPLYSILHSLPNPEMTAIELREALVCHLALWGNAYAYIGRDAGGRVNGLWPLRPDRMEVQRLSPGELGYLYQLQTGEKRALRMDEIMHLRLMSLDGMMGLSPIAQARESIALTWGTEEYGARFFGNDSRPGGVLKHPGKLTEEAAKRLKSGWEEAHRGLDQAHRVAILEEGMDWVAVGIPPQDAQFLETRKFQVTEVARLFRMPPHMIADLERATFSNIEQQSIDYVVHTLMPWLVRIEQGINRDLLTETERRTWYAEHLLAGLLRGDTPSRYAAYAVGRQNGWLSADDVREFENMNPLPNGEGKIYMVPLNMVPASQVGQGAEQGEMSRALETRASTGGAESRRNLGRRFRRVFEDAGGRIVRKERQEVGALAEKWLGRRDAPQFLAAVAQFYRDLPPFAERALLPALLSFAEVIEADAVGEVGGNGGQTSDLEPFVRDYNRVAASDWGVYSQAQLDYVVNTAEERGEEPAAAVKKRLDEWGEKRAADFAAQHTVELAGAVTVLAWRRHGVRRLRWVSHGESCPYCRALGGRIVGIEGYFLTKGDEFSPEGAETKFVPGRSVRHAPLHGGCDCGIAPA